MFTRRDSRQLDKIRLKFLNNLYQLAKTPLFANIATHEQFKIEYSAAHKQW